MINISNDTIQTLLRCLPLILEHVDYSTGGVRLKNAVRLTKKTINKLNKITTKTKKEEQ